MILLTIQLQNELKLTCLHEMYHKKVIKHNEKRSKDYTDD